MMPLNVRAHGTLWAVAHLRCPRCHHGKVFNGLISMNQRCPVCGLQFEREPGYFVGAMYFSYAFASVIIGTVVAILYAMVPKLPGIWVYLISCCVLLPFVPAIFRYSRVLWMTFDRSIDMQG